MILKKKWINVERERLRGERPDLEENLRIIAALYDEAVALGALPVKDPLEGLDVAIRIARAVNSVSKAA